MGDGKAQALNIWLKEFIYSILIQPFHCIMYIALINTAFRLLDSASYSPFESLPEMLNTLEFNQLANGVLAILCLKFVSDGEKIVRKIFGFADDNTKTSMGAGAIAAIALVSNAAKVGATARKGINTAKNTTRRLGTAFGNDYAKIKNSNLYGKFSNKLSNSKLGQFGQSAKSRANSLKESSTGMLKNSTGAKNIRNLANKATTLAGKYNGSGLQKAVSQAATMTRRHLPGALAAMGMAMVYASGDTSLLEANAIRKGISDSAGTFFNSSTGSQAEFERDNMDALEKADYE